MQNIVSSEIGLLWLTARIHNRLDGNLSMRIEAEVLGRLWYALTDDIISSSYYDK